MTGDGGDAGGVEQPEREREVGADVGADRVSGETRGIRNAGRWAATSASRCRTTKPMQSSARPAAVVAGVLSMSRLTPQPLVERRGVVEELRAVVVADELEERDPCAGVAQAGEHRGP